MGALIQKENEAPLGPEVKGDENREEVSLLINYGVWESVMNSPSGVRGGAPVENGFIVILYPQIASSDSKFFTFSS